MPTVKREEFLHQLESVQPGIAPRETIEQSSCVVFQGGQMMTFNEEIACSYATELEFEGAVAAKPLIDILRKYTEETVELLVTESELQVRGGRRRSGVRLEAEIALPIDAVERPEEWRKLPEGFAAAVARIQPCAGKDDANFNLTCVHIHPKWVEACDNFQISRVQMKTGFKESTLVRRESIRYMTDLGMTEISETPTWLHFRNPQGLVLSCRRYAEDYPDLTPMLKVEGTTVALPKGLKEASEAAEIFSAENVDSNQVQITLRPGKVKIRGQGVSGWHEQVMKADYQGDPLAFLISPTVLMDIVRTHNDCIISADRLKVEDGKFSYISCLSTPSENGEG